MISHVIILPVEFPLAVLFVHLSQCIHEVLSLERVSDSELLEQDVEASAHDFRKSVDVWCAWVRKVERYLIWCEEAENGNRIIIYSVAYLNFFCKKY